jgi:hypothetical protein
MKDVMVAFKTGSIMSKKAIVVSKSVGDTQKLDFVGVDAFSILDVSRHCAQLISFSCFWTMLAASSVICRLIKSIYPVVNGPTDQYIHMTSMNYFLN